MKIKRLFFTLLLFSLSIQSFAGPPSVCNSAPVGTVSYRNGGDFYCNGYWTQMGDQNAADSCTAGEAGKQKYGYDSYVNKDGLMYCDGSYWMSLSMRELGSAACSSPGTIHYESSRNAVEFCGPNFKWVDTTGNTMPTISFCFMIGSQATCDADPSCYWSGASCVDCSCKR